MNRQDRFPDTETFHYYNANPKNKLTDDCVIRALCTALEEPYEVVYKELFEFSLKCGYMLNCKQCFDKYLQSKGWKKQKQPRKADNTKYTGKEWCLKLQEDFDWVIGKSKNIIANIGGHHIVAIVDGRINDTWNSTAKSIGNYWIKK